MASDIAAVVWLANLLILAAAAAAAAAGTEHVRHLEISEGAPSGTRIGFIGDGASPDSGPPYLIVPVGSAVDSDLAIDHTTGEIRTKIALDRETRAAYSLVAIPMSGDNVKVIVKVLDENDNAPIFPMPVMHIEFPENTPRDVKRTLHPARDSDLDVYNTQKYNIVSGNVNNAFKLSSHRERDGVLYLDLQINGYLDRETTSAYSLVIEALDGGTPPLRGEMIVNITIQDVNDNPPIFNQSRYFATIQENATVGTSVLKVIADDADSEENGQIEYSINRRQSDKDNMFRIDATTGLIAVNKPLDFEAKDLHELVIVAKDHGLQPLEAAAFVSIKVTDVNDNQPTINVIFLSDDATPKISESARPGQFVARISVRDPDSKTDYSNVNVTLEGGDGRFGLTTRDNIVYLVIVSMPLDREAKANYTLTVEATDKGTPPLHATRTIDLRVTDVNDNAPAFRRDVYYADVMEASEPGVAVLEVVADDRDEGENGAVRYSLGEASGWFRIEERSGLVRTRARVDCETDPAPRLTVIATDGGFPPLSASATVVVTVHDVNDNEPIFDQSFYNVSVPEDERVGHCFLKVSATDPDCGVNAMVNYTLGEGNGKPKEFTVRSDTGDICIGSSLDYETRNLYEFPVIATDRGGLSTTAMVKIQITDVNDNRPAFYPSEYNVSLRDGALSSSTPVVAVAATDADSGKFGAVRYRIVAGDDAGVFRVDASTGELFVERPGLLSAGGRPRRRLNVSATDGGGLRSLRDAEVFISVVDSAHKPPIFERARYAYSIGEGVAKGTVVGTVKAAVTDGAGRSNVYYSIYSGDPDGLFIIDGATGIITTSSPLDHESKSSVLLNIQATSGDPPVYGHTQVNIEIEDVNDNAPEFESPLVRISVPENAEVGSPLYSAHAGDRDSGRNGAVEYKMAGNPYGGLFKVDAKSGDLTVARRLDYETSQRQSLVITATDSGVPPLAANLTVMVEVQDVNDNAPVFERKEYSLRIVESAAVNTQLLQLTAIDADSGNNARLTYRLIAANATDAPDAAFGVFPATGWLYLRAPLDRERRDRYRLTVAASDNGVPSATATALVLVQVLDANDNDPVFAGDSYEFAIEENLRRGTFIGGVGASDADLGQNAALRYSLIPGNSSFAINPVTGEITSREPLDRERKRTHELVVEARDQGTPPRSTRVPVLIRVLDVNDNAPEIVDPQEDVISVREEQPPGTEVVRIRAVDADSGSNATVTYSILKDRDYDGYGAFAIDPITGAIKTKSVLDHEEKTIYRLAVAAKDGGQPPKQTVRILRIEVLDLNDNRPTFTSSSLAFRVREDAAIGHVVGSIALPEPVHENSINGAGGHVTYTLTSLSADKLSDAFDVDRSTGSLVVSRRLDRETQADYKLEIRALDTSAMNNPQSSAITVKIEVTDVNDNPPKWPRDPITISVSENAEIGASIYNLTATDADSGSNSDLRYSLLEQHPQSDVFSVDSLTGALNLASKLDFEATKEYLLVVLATDQCQNASERLSASATLRLLVDDYNDNAPRFVAPAGVVYTSDSNALGTTVAHLVAVDEDRGDNGRVTYAMSGGNDEGLFSLGYDTGSLTLTKPLEDNGKSFVLNVTASDHGNPSKTTAMELKLIVQSFVDAAPKFLEVRYAVEVAEDVAVDTVIAKLSARSGLTEANNLTFILPSDETFRINSPTGEVLAKKRLDREAIDTYILTVFVSDSSYKTTLFDTTTLIIKVTDINDNTPKFRTGSCYRLSVPENSETSVVHTMVAEDGDEGSNGEVYYTITSGNAGNKFSIDTKTGELTARPLDRESQSKYFLTIVARDRGTPAMQSVCNLTVTVEDQNDNDPKFDLSEYSTAVLENVPVDTSVLKVHASDADLGINARIIYSLSNESHWLFRVDNKTGVITTTGSFDREKENVYTFLIVATDGGKYNARSQSVPVTVKILDFNDNKPTFTRYPFKEKVTPYIQPGQRIIKITATDNDEATNAEIVYTISTDDSNGKFRINPNTGIITTTQSLAAHKGKIIYLNVLASDKGNPPMSSSGLVEIQVGDLPETSPSLLFQNATYAVTLAENAERLKEVVRVGAVRSDGRRQRVLYSIGAGDDTGVFIIDSTTGVIQVRDPDGLDFELHRNLALVVEARTEGQPDLRGYCDVIVQLTDENDNSPKFTQRQYAASVWEGNKKGEFVLQVVAGDADEGANSRILYHIVDGNHDNAFKIEPAFSGILKTNIVLDREIRDAYRLTVIATDEGVPQMTGTARIRINVVDVNDNQPTFPPHSVITVKEDTPVGTVLTIATANDVDTYPPLTYGFAKDNYKKDLRYFSIDRYSGKVILKKSLDYETWQECKIGIVASDGVHSAQTSLTIKVIDVNDNAPSFSQSSYFATLPEGNSPTLIDIAYLNASDADSEENAKLQYSLVSSLAGFSIDADEGILKANLSATSRYTDEILLTIKATDMGNPPQHSIVPIRIRTNGDASSTGSKTLGKMEYKITVRENTTRGSTIMHLTKPPSISSTYYRIVDGNDDGNFEAINPSGALLLVKPLDRETRDAYNLKITADTSSMSLVTVEITVEDSNDNPPAFQSPDHATTISENLPIGASVEALLAIDADLPHTPNSRILYSITSGNDEGCFALDSHTGLLTVNKSLDFDRGSIDYNLVVKACDEGSPSLCALQTIAVSLQDENDNEPMFPVSEYFEFVGENEAVGTVVFTARASDADRGRFGRLTYSILPSYAQLDNSWKLFNVDPTTGLVTTSTAFDYEQRSRYNFVIKAEDAGGKFTSVKVRVDIEGKDEFHPQFTERTYKLTLATSSALPIGYIVGHVTATDRDKGPDGRVVYQLMTQHSYFKVNRTTGDILVKKKFDYVEIPNSGREISLVITASSGRQGSLTNMTVVEIILDPLADPGTNLAINRGDTIPATTSGIADWALGLLIALLLLIIAFGAAFVFLHMRNKRNKQSTKPNLGAADAVSTANNFVDALPIRGVAVAAAAGQFAPPKYDEIPPYGAPHAASSNSGAATTSELSGSEQSGSSGRGSAEDDGDDEEIRMINEGPMQLRTNDDDSLSNTSVRNTQEYLARLGINNTIRNGARIGADRANQPAPLGMFNEESNDNDIAALIYAKLNDVGGGDRAGDVPTGAHMMNNYGEVQTATHQPSMNGSLSSIVHSEEELAGSYNWDYLLDWGPQYQPLAHVFSEIARLKDDTASVHSGASGASSAKSKKAAPAPAAGRGRAALVAPRSPISHEGGGGGAAMSPSFAASLSPLATKSGAGAAGLPVVHHVIGRQAAARGGKSMVDAELSI